MNTSRKMGKGMCLFQQMMKGTTMFTFPQL